MLNASGPDLNQSTNMSEEVQARSTTLRADSVNIKNFTDFSGGSFVENTDIDSNGHVGLTWEPPQSQYETDGNTLLLSHLDNNFDGSYDDYNDPDRSTKLLHIIDGDDDDKNDFVIGVDEPQIYWDPDDDILTNITKEDVDKDGDFEYAIDVDGDGEIEKVINDDNVYNSPDLFIEEILFC